MATNSRIQFGRQVYDYFIAKGLPPHQAAAIAGNMAWEGGGKAGLLQGHRCRRRGHGRRPMRSTCCHRRRGRGESRERGDEQGARAVAFLSEAHRRGLTVHVWTLRGENRFLPSKWVHQLARTRNIKLQ